MIRAFIGTDRLKRDSLLQQALKEWLGDRADDPLVRSSIQADESEIDPVEKVFELCNTTSMFSEKSAVIFSNCEKLTASKQDELLKYCKAPSETAALFLMGNKIDGRGKLGKFFAKNKWTVKCEAMKDYEVPRWIVARMQERFQRRLSMGDAQLIQDLAGSDTSILDGELEKLHLHAGSDALATEDILEVVSAQREATSFELQDAFGHRNGVQGLEILYKLLRSDERPAFVQVQMLYKHARDLLTVSEAMDAGMPTQQIAGKIRKHPYIFEKICNYPKQARQRPPLRLCRIMARLSEIESEMKTGMHSTHQEVETLLYPLFHS